jgi:hypothetical protein
MIRAVEDKAKKEGKELPGGALFALVSMTSGRLAMNAIRDLGARVLIERREFGLTPSSRTRSQRTVDAILHPRPQSHQEDAEAEKLALITQLARRNPNLRPSAIA